MLSENILYRIHGIAAIKNHGKANIQAIKIKLSIAASLVIGVIEITDQRNHGGKDQGGKYELAVSHIRPPALPF